MVFNLDLHLDQRLEMHTRIITNIFDLLAELGGVLEVVVITVLVFLAPLFRHNYHMDLLNSLYFAKTKDSTLFQETCIEDQISSSNSK